MTVCILETSPCEKQINVNTKKSIFPPFLYEYLTSLSHITLDISVEMVEPHSVFDG